MAIFGKKKDAKGDPTTTGSPTQEQGRNVSGAASSSAASHSGPAKPSASNGTAAGGSAPSGSEFGSPNSLNGPPGAASGFKFGNPPSVGSVAARQDPTSPPRKSGETGPAAYAMNSMSGSAPGLPSSSAGGPPFMNGAPGPNGPPAPSSASAAGSERGSGRPQQVVYPWSQRQLTLNPPRFLDANRQAPPGTLSPSPFPRYGLAANSTASPQGEVYLFGGLVRESVKNDLYTVYVDKVVQPPAPPGTPPPPAGGSLPGGVSATLVQTTGEIPPPRVGHATVLVSNVLILWGGDTKVRADDKQDEGLYLLNLSTREWTRVVSTKEGPNACPMGRYGHTVSIVGSKFYVFGGQVDGLFLNDLWSFDLNSLKGNPQWELVKPTGDSPPQRTGHASVTYKDKIYIFGGTDGQYHYNDTWCYDVATNSWSELSCIGYIPVPREGHSTCLVDDVMYIFGGRGVDGKDLGDLASFKISNQRWYMFANMGPSPSGRSGHALTTFQNKVIVLGGESFTGSKPDDPAVVHVLDTGKIKYPPDNASAKGGASTIRKNSGPTAPGQAGATGPGMGPASIAQRSMSPTGERAASPVQGGGRQPLNGIVSMMNAQQSPPTVSEQQQAGPPGSKILGSPPQIQQAQQQPVTAPMRAMSPTQGLGQAPRQQPLQSALGPQQPNNAATIGTVAGAAGAAGAVTATQSALQQRAMSPPTNLGTGPASTYTGPRSQRSIENMRAGQPPQVAGTTSAGASPLTKTTAFPAVNGFSSAAAAAAAAPGGPAAAGATPADGFYSQIGINGVAANNGVAAAPAATSAELEAYKKREAWMKTVLALAVKKGFIPPEQIEGEDAENVQAPDDLDLNSIDTGVEGTDKERIVKALITLKTKLAAAQSTIAEQAQRESDKVGEAERNRSAALQEATFYRAKLHALESDNLTEASRLEHERVMQLETRIAEALQDKSALERQISSLREQAKLEQQLRGSAEERLSETAKRAMSAEAAQMKAYEEVSALQKRSYAAESSLREHVERVSNLTSLLARQKADHEYVRGQLEEAHGHVDQHLTSLTQLQTALDASTARAAEHERLHYQHRDLADTHQQSISQLQLDLQQKTTEAAANAARVAELETLIASLRQEAESHRTASSTGLAQVLQTRELLAARNAEGNLPPHVIEKMRALEEETDSLRQMHTTTRTAADQAAATLAETRERSTLLEKQHSGLRSELSVVRSQLAIALQELARLKDQASAKEIQLRDTSRSAEAAEIKANLLRRVLAEKGLSIPGDDELAGRDGLAEQRVQTLQAEVDARTRQVEELQQRMHQSQQQIETLTRSASGAVDSSQLIEAQRRAEAAEKELADTTLSYKERMAQLESDYQTAVQFVKGTEKMLRRMKDELTKYKTENAQLQADIAALRAGGSSQDGTEAARDIEALRTRLQDVTHQSEEVAAENRDLERRIATLISEQKEAHDRTRGLADSRADSAKKAQILEGEVSKLENSLVSVREELQKTLTLNQHLSNELNKANSSGGAGSTSLARDVSAAQAANEQLRHENQELAQRLHETEEKFQLLLGRMESTHADDPQRDSMQFGSITSQLDRLESSLPSRS